MADKLEYLDKHLTIIRWLTIEDAVKNENYKIRPDIAPVIEGLNTGESAIFKLAGCGLVKDACELMAYVSHRRAAVWWAYRCVNSLLEEFGKMPPQNRDIADIGADFTPKVPDWAKVKMPEPVDTSSLDALIAKQKAANAEMLKNVNPEMLKYVQDCVEVAFQEFKKVHGIHPMDLIKKLGEKLQKPEFKISPASPVFQAEAALKAQVQAVRKETVDKIKAVIPPKVPEHEKKLRDNALNAIFRWIVAPDAENSQKCLDIGNECPDMPAGLLSLAAFWSYGDLMPLGKQAVPAPPGLAANGISQVLLKCALAKGGTRTFTERFNIYFQFGIDVFTGKDTWEEAVAEGKAPHENMAAPQPAQSKTESENQYKRWKG